MSGYSDDPSRLSLCYRYLIVKLPSHPPYNAATPVDRNLLHLFTIIHPHHQNKIQNTIIPADHVTTLAKHYAFPVFFLWLQTHSVWDGTNCWSHYNDILCTHGQLTVHHSSPTLSSQAIHSLPVSPMAVHAHKMAGPGLRPSLLGNCYHWTGRWAVNFILQFSNSAIRLTEKIDHTPKTASKRRFPLLSNNRTIFI